MLVAINGYYENGKVFLKEDPHVAIKTDVIVTFLSDEIIKTEKPRKRILGALEGKIRIPENFNDPIEDFKDYM